MNKSKLLLVICLIVSIGYLALIFNRWDIYIIDVGLDLHSAVRVLKGELPYVDFDAGYTGGLAFFEALIFKIFGVSLLTARISMLFFYIILITRVIMIANSLVRGR